MLSPAFPATPAAAQQDPTLNLAVAGQLGGTSYAVATQGELVFTGVGPRLVVFDARDPAALRVAGRSEVLDGVPIAIVVRRDIAYVGAGDILYIVDIADARRPQVVGSHYVGWHTALALSGDHVLVTATSHLLSIDVSDPVSPRRVESIQFGPRVQLHDIAIDGGVAYVAVGQLGLMVLDVSKPAAPRPMASLDTPADAQTVAAGGGFAYVGDAYVVGGERTSLGVIDTRDPAAPVEVARIGHFGIPFDLHLAEDRLYVAAQGGGVLELDVSTPSLPKERSRTRTPGHALGVSTVDGHVFVADELDGLHVLALATSPPTLLPGRPMTRWVNDVALADGRAFIAEGGRFGGGVRMLDVTDPAAPREIAHVDTTGDPVAVPGQIKSVEVRGDMVYATGFAGDGLHVLRAVEGERLEPVSFIALEPPRDLAVSGGHAYVLHYAGVAVVDVSRPERPRLLTTIAAGGGSQVVIADDIAYVAGSREGVPIFDVSEPATPRRLGTIDATALALAVEGEVAVILDGYSLRTFDISNPSDPRPMAVLAMPGTSPDVDMRDGIAYLSLGRQGVAVVDVSRPAQPALLDRLDYVCCNGVVVGGDHLYLPGMNYGLVVVSLYERPTPTPTPTPTRGPPPSTPMPPAGGPYRIHLPIAVANSSVFIAE